MHKRNQSISHFKVSFIVIFSKTFAWFYAILLCWTKILVGFMICKKDKFWIKIVCILYSLCKNYLAQFPQNKLQLSIENVCKQWINFSVYRNFYRQFFTKRLFDFRHFYCSWLRFLLNSWVMKCMLKDTTVWDHPFKTLAFFFEGGRGQKFADG